MTSKQVYRLAKEWAQSQGNPIGPIIDYFAQVYDLTSSQICEVRALAAQEGGNRNADPDHNRYPCQAGEYCH